MNDLHCLIGWLVQWLMNSSSLNTTWGAEKSATPSFLGINMPQTSPSK